MTGIPDTPDGSTVPVDWRAQYLRQRRRTRAWTAATVVALVLLGGSVALHLTADTTPLPSPTHPARDLGAGRGDAGGFLDRLFHDDGTLDRETAEQLVDQAVRNGFGDRLRERVEDEVANGALTRAQADELLALLDDAEGGR